GMDRAPHLVRACYRSLRENLPDKEIILITSENMSDYVTFPDYIIEKWEKGQITHTHMTDLLRLELLIQY
ncbi:capsular biosynthesis protein, partial [Klebsiella oxytoca]